LISIPLGELDVRIYRVIKKQIDRSPNLINGLLAGAYTLAFFTFAAIAAFPVG
jgi:hypothetical protein